MNNWDHDIVQVNLPIKSVLEIIRSIISKESRTELLRYTISHAYTIGNPELLNICEQIKQEYEIQLFGPSPITSASIQNRTTSYLDQQEMDVLNPSINRIKECITKAMRQLVSNNLIKKKQDWAAVYQIIIERDLYLKLTKKDFVDMVKSQHFTDELVPASSSNLDKMIFSTTHQYPNWSIDGKSAKELQRLTHIAECFLAFYQS